FEKDYFGEQTVRCPKEWLNTIIERKEKEEIQKRRRQEEIEGRKLQEEIQIEERKQQEKIAEQKRQEEIAERKRQEEIQELWRQEEIEECRRKEEYEERKRKDEMEYELQKIRIGAEGRFSNSVANQNVNSSQIKPKLELYHLMQKFNSDESDISLYLIMFEHLTKQAEISENSWVTHLLGLLPCDVAQLIAREPDEIAKDYNEVKKMLLKRYKLTPEKFR
ncbi:hypothetical protein AVEN_49376-1, partial [Araneus ventricosus]